MPAGLTWPKYIRLLGTSMFFMFLGAQFVHNQYKPLADLPEFIEKYKEEMKNDSGPSKTIVLEQSSKKT